MLFYQPQDGYCFNSDSIFLYDFALRFAPPRGRLLDVGCGVGVIGLLLARDSGMAATLVEKQPKMARYAQINAKNSGLDCRVVQSDFLDFEDDGQFDMIISNPPFYHENVVRSPDEHIDTCRCNVHLPLEPFFKKVKRLVKPRGRFVFCYDPTQSDRIFHALEAAGLQAEDVRYVHPKIDRAAKLVLVHARNQSRSRVRVLPPLIVYEGDGYGPEAMEAFKKARTHAIKCLIA